MGNVTLTIQKMTDAGLGPSYTGSLSTENTYKLRNTGHQFIHVKKSEATDCVVTIVTPITHNGLVVADREVTVAASSGDELIGPFPPALYNDAAGDVDITFGNIAGLTIGAFEF